MICYEAECYICVITIVISAELQQIYNFINTNNKVVLIVDYSVSEAEI